MESDTESPTSRLTARAPIFLTGCARSGTTLFARLLDGHPDVLVFPIELKYFRYRDTPTDYPTMRLARLSGPRDVVRAVAESDYVRPFFGEKDEIGGREEVIAAVRSTIDTRRFRDVLGRDDLIATHADGVVHFFRALGTALGLSEDQIQRLRFVEKTPYQEENVDEIRDWFPDASFVHLVRNPYAVMVSERKRGAAEHMKLHAAAMQQSSLARAIRNKEALGDRYLIIRYEDLVGDPGRVMIESARFLGLSEHPTLTEPTILGRPWHGNSSAGQRLVGISTAAAERWKTQIHDREVSAVNRDVGFELEHFGYERLATPPFYRTVAWTVGAGARRAARKVIRRISRIASRRSA